MIYIISKKEINTMRNAYSMLYIIENSLRSYIIQNMRKDYGLDWYRVAPRKQKLRSYNKSFNKLYFHELIPFIIVYPCLSNNLPNNLANDLRNLISIRNKIAHHKYLTNDEFNKLVACYNKLIVYLII